MNSSDWPRINKHRPFVLGTHASIDDPLTENTELKYQPFSLHSRLRDLLKKFRERGTYKTNFFYIVLKSISFSDTVVS